MPIKFDSRAKNYARSRGMDSLPQDALAKIDRDRNRSISLEEAARAGAMARLNGDGAIDAQERSRIDRILGMTSTPTTTRPTSSTSSQPTRPTRPTSSTTPTSSTPSRPTSSTSSTSSTHSTTTSTPSTDPAPSRPVRRAGEGLELPSALLERHDSYDRGKLEAWADLVNDNLDQPTEKKLHLANAFFNSRLTYASDRQVWQERDYWASPVESLGKGGGDCDDFTISKYVTLRKMGVPKEELKLAVVYYMKPGEPRQAHMVLLHQPPGGESTILDNIDKGLKGIGERRDLVPIYTFNEAGLWLARGNKWDAQLLGVDPGARLSKWQDVQERMGREGIW